MSEWWLSRGDGKTEGPFSTQVVIQGLVGGNIPKHALVCAVGAQQWIRVSAVDEIWEAVEESDSKTSITETPWFLGRAESGRPSVPDIGKGNESDPQVRARARPSAERKPSEGSSSVADLDPMRPRVPTLTGITDVPGPVVSHDSSRHQAAPPQAVVPVKPSAGRIPGTAERSSLQLEAGLTPLAPSTRLASSRAIGAGGFAGLQALSPARPSQMPPIPQGHPSEGHPGGAPSRTGGTPAPKAIASTGPAGVAATTPLGPQQELPHRAAALIPTSPRPHQERVSMAPSVQTSKALEHDGPMRHQAVPMPSSAGLLRAPGAVLPPSYGASPLARAGSPGASSHDLESVSRKPELPSSPVLETTPRRPAPLGHDAAPGSDSRLLRSDRGSAQDAETSPLAVPAKARLAPPAAAPTQTGGRTHSAAKLTPPSAMRRPLPSGPVLGMETQAPELGRVKSGPAATGSLILSSAAPTVPGSGVGLDPEDEKTVAGVFGTGLARSGEWTDDEPTQFLNRADPLPPVRPKMPSLRPPTPSAPILHAPPLRDARPAPPREPEICDEKTTVLEVKTGAKPPTAGIADIASAETDPSKPLAAGSLTSQTAPIHSLVSDPSELLEDVDDESPASHGILAPAAARQPAGQSTAQNAESANSTALAAPPSTPPPARKARLSVPTIVLKPEPVIHQEATQPAVRALRRRSPIRLSYGALIGLVLLLAVAAVAAYFIVQR